MRRPRCHACRVELTCAVEVSLDRLHRYCIVPLRRTPLPRNQKHRHSRTLWLCEECARRKLMER